jgi:hypothetical protein
MAVVTSFGKVSVRGKDKIVVMDNSIKMVQKTTRNFVLLSNGLTNREPGSLFFVNIVENRHGCLMCMHLKR